MGEKVSEKAEYEQGPRDGKRMEDGQKRIEDGKLYGVWVWKKIKGFGGMRGPMRGNGSACRPLHA